MIRALNNINTTLSDKHLLRILKLTDPVRYNNIAKEFCKITPKGDFQKDDERIIFLIDLSYSINCLGFRATKYSVDYKNTVDNKCQNTEADELIKQFNRVASALIKAKKEDLPIGSVSSAIDGYR
jgi:hypothetical protein